MRAQCENEIVTYGDGLCALPMSDVAGVVVILQAARCRRCLLNVFIVYDVYTSPYRLNGIEAALEVSWSSTVSRLGVKSCRCVDPGHGLSPVSAGSTLTIISV